MFAAVDWRDVALFLAIAAVGYGIVAVFFRLRRRPETPRDPAPICPNPECRQVNTARARYCSRCGAEMTK